MAKAAYVGVNGTPKKITNMYVGVNGTPKKVLKGYVGVNGVPKLFWESSAQAYSWDLWTTVEGQQLFTDDSVFTVSKRYGKIAYWGLVPNSTHSGYYTPILMSPDPQARAAWVRVRNTSTGSATTYGAITNIEDVNGNTWYCACPQQAMLVFNSAPSFLITDEIKTIDEYAQIFLDKIYAVPFHEDYQAGESYTLPTSDLSKTVRKVIGTFLHRNINYYSVSTAYQLLSDNIDTIISFIENEVTAKGNEHRLLLINIYLYYGEGNDTVEIQALHGTNYTIGSVNSITNASVINSSTVAHYNYKSFSSPDYPDPNFDYSEEAYPDWATLVHINDYDNPSSIGYETMDAWDSQFPSIPYRVGLMVDEGNYYKGTQITNLGIDL